MSNRESIQDLYRRYKHSEARKRLGLRYYGIVAAHAWEKTRDRIWPENKRCFRPDRCAAGLKRWYKRQTGDDLDLEHPKSFNEKIQWLKLYDSTPLKTRLADKYLVRDWVKEKAGEQYLVPLLGVWDSFAEIDFSTLPQSFVLKANHGCGWNLLVKDKSKLNMEDAKRQFDIWMHQNYAFDSFELHYANISPKIIAEPYMEAFQEIDYKIMCFDGKPKFLMVVTDRFTNHKRTLFSLDWEKMDQSIAEGPVDYAIPRPEGLEKIVQLASVLAQGFSLVRIDFNRSGKDWYFGEMTFTPDSGLLFPIKPQEFSLEMGNWITLPEPSPFPIQK